MVFSRLSQPFSFMRANCLNVNIFQVVVSIVASYLLKLAETWDT